MGANTMTEHTEHYDALETRAPAMREAELFSRLPDVLRKAMAAPAYAERFQGIDPAGVTSRAALPCIRLRRRSVASSPGFPARSGGYLPRQARSSSPRQRMPTPGAAHGRCSRPASARATWC
jgi:hypothetical protein